MCLVETKHTEIKADGHSLLWELQGILSSFLPELLHMEWGSRCLKRANQMYWHRNSYYLLHQEFYKSCYNVQGMPGVGGGAAGLGALDFLRNNPQVLTSYFSIDICLILVTFVWKPSILTGTVCNSFEMGQWDTYLELQVLCWMMWDSDVSCENVLVIFPLSLTRTFWSCTSLLSASIVYMTLNFVFLDGMVIHLLVWQSSSITSA